MPVSCGEKRWEGRPDVAPVNASVVLEVLFDLPLGLGALALVDVVFEVLLGLGAFAVLLVFDVELEGAGASAVGESVLAPPLAPAPADPDVPLYTYHYVCRSGTRITFEDLIP